MSLVTRFLSAIAATSALALALAACGSDTEKASAPPGTYTLEQACTVALGKAVAIVPVASAKNNNLPYTKPPSNDFDALQFMKDDGEQGELKKNARQLTTNADSAADALAAKRTEEVTRLVNESKAPYDAILKTCENSGSKSLDSAKNLRKELDKEPAASSSARPSPTSPSSASSSPAPKPFKPSAPGTRVKFGEPLFFTFTDRDGNTGKVSVKVVSIEKAPDSDLKAFSKSTLESVGQVMYLRTEIQVLDIATSKLVAERIDPKFKIKTNDGSGASSLTTTGSFKPCKSGFSTSLDKPLANCQLVGLSSKSAVVELVGMLDLGAQNSVGEPKFIWVK